MNYLEELWFFLLQFLIISTVGIFFLVQYSNQFYTIFTTNNISDPICYSSSGLHSYSRVLRFKKKRKITKSSIPARVKRR